ncbi:fatty acid cis/trans isomerase [Granulosicoccus sp. 3-233]|uniref:fatty acid cis/trans isomerase n=1 Tax=Granulosicoccus sp. 3-233 TaxID=3417969 RepID=UPI003D3267FC
MLLTSLLICSACLQVKPAAGEPEPLVGQLRSELPDSAVAGIDFLDDVKPILDTRCIACHACYDAPCQLKTSAAEGLSRGASKARVYHSTRLLPADPTRLFVDEQTTEGWRDKGFFSVFGEPHDGKLEAGLMRRFLELKQQAPPLQPGILPDTYTVGLNRENECPTVDEFDAYARRHPEAGMPYALPPLSDAEQSVLLRWLDAGAPYQTDVAVSPQFSDALASWESFFNRQTDKGRLVSRYLYEHLYLGHLYFPDISPDTFFRLVRSASPPGEPVEFIATRRPFDDPGVDTVHYRLVPERETIVAKTHNPYRLDADRLARFELLFFNDDYTVDSLPGYQADSNANPFVTFAALPMNSRYRFMLEEARFTIANYIRGSVCRGQIAVSVIRDRFWVFFVNPESPVNEALASFLPTVSKELALANSNDSSIGLTPLLHWGHYARLEHEHHMARDQALADWFSTNEVSLDMIWKGGEENNPNAALTVLRHGDYAAVEQGLLGQAPPDTAWVIDYPLLERIHYLLVAGYDVYGTLGHQLTSRLHMDFLRMQGEKNLLAFVPPDARRTARDRWYRDAPEDALDYMSNRAFDQVPFRGIDYRTDDPLTELYGLLASHLKAVQPDDAHAGQTLAALETFKGEKTALLPQVTLLRVDGDGPRYVSILRNDAHLNMSSVFQEEKQLIPAENTVTVLPGIRGFYPNALMQVDQADLQEFVQAVLSLDDADSYSRLLDDYGVRRSDPRFWALSDELHEQWQAADPTGFGYLDFSRLENR